MSISETADSFLKGVINVRDSDTRSIYGLTGFTIVDRAQAFPGIYDFTNGTSFVERGYRGEVGGADYNIEKDADDPTVAHRGLTTALTKTIKEVLPVYIEGYDNTIVLGSILEDLSEAVSIDQLVYKESELDKMLSDIAAVATRLDEAADEEDDSTLNASIAQSLSYAIRQYALFNTMLNSQKGGNVSFTPSILGDLKRASVACASSLGNSYAKMLVGSDTFSDADRFKDLTRSIALELGGGIATSESLEEFVRNLSFIVDLSDTYNLDKEPLIEQRLRDCAMAAAEHCGVEYNPSYPPGMFIYRLTLNTAPDLSADVLDMAYDAVEDCLNIADS
jgi:hypothetical protein